MCLLETQIGDLFMFEPLDSPWCLKNINPSQLTTKVLEGLWTQSPWCIKHINPAQLISKVVRHHQPFEIAPVMVSWLLVAFLAQGQCQGSSKNPKFA